MVQLQWFGRYGVSAHRLWYEKGRRDRHFFPLECLKSQLVEMFSLVRFQSQQFIIIHHTHKESLEWSSCSGLGVMVSVLTDFGMKRGDEIATFSPANDSK
eukprot:scaffold16743_cov76-Cyclotella_meneghiniana.AAC.1